MSRIARPAAPRGTDMLAAGANLGRKTTPAVAAATAAADDANDDRGGAFVHLTTSAVVAGVTKPAGVPASVFEAGKMARPRPKQHQRIDLSKYAIEHDVPLPVAVRTRAGAPYAELLARMRPGDSIKLPEQGAKSLQGAAKRLGAKATIRVLGDGMARVWLQAVARNPAGKSGAAS
jgi:hypothetical protein